jgi:hypothetical protein
MGRCLHALPTAVDQADAERVLHLGDRLRHRRLRQIKLSSGFRHAAPAHDSVEQPQVAQLEALGNAVDQIHGSFANEVK